MRGNQHSRCRAQCTHHLQAAPDVHAGYSVGRVPDAEILMQADETVRDESMAALLAQVDAVYVLTSLTQFEALQRGLDVTTNGRPSMPAGV